MKHIERACLAGALLAVSFAAHAVKITEYTVPTAASTPYTIISAFGELWFTEYDGNKIGRMTTAGAFPAEFSIPEVDCGPVGLALGPRGRIYFAENAHGALSWLSRDGTFGAPVFGLPGAGSVAL